MICLLYSLFNKKEIFFSLPSSSLDWSPDSLGPKSRTSWLRFVYSHHCHCLPMCVLVLLSSFSYARDFYSSATVGNSFPSGLCCGAYPSARPELVDSCPLRSWSLFEVFLSGQVRAYHEEFSESWNYPSFSVWWFDENQAILRIHIPYTDSVFPVFLYDGKSYESGRIYGLGILHFHFHERFGSKLTRLWGRKSPYTVRLTTRLTT